MREILKFKGRIKPLVEITLAFMRENHEVFAAQDVMYSLQMATYWIQEGAELSFLSSARENDLVQESEPMRADETPKLETSEKRIHYLYVKLGELVYDILKFLETTKLDSLAHTWLVNAATRLTEAKFSVGIMKIQYNGLQRTGGPSLLTD